MELEDHEIRKIWYALKACKHLMEKELEKRREALPPDDLETAENELVALSDLLQKVNVEKEQLGVDIGQFTHYGAIFFPDI